MSVSPVCNKLNGLNNTINEPTLRFTDNNIMYHMEPITTEKEEAPRPNWCFCVKAELASLSVGVLYFIVNVIAMLGGFIYLGVTQGQDHLEPEVEKIVLAAVLPSCFLCGLNAVACLLLVMGVRRRRWELVFAWLAWFAIFQGLLTIGWLGGVIHLAQDVAPRTHPSNTADFSWRVLVPLLPVGIIALVFVWYSYSAVVSFCRTLRAEATAADKGNYRVVPDA